MSLVNVHEAEWRKRKINLLNVIRSFVSQLTPGQDLTKVSLPSELCHPFSMLELIAQRELQLFHIVFDINRLEDPQERFLQVVRWYLGLVREETIEKKPFNPVIQETHLCWVRHTPEADDVSEFIAEQVSHHPPVSAFVVRNKKQKITIQGDVTFSVGFGSNYASVNTAGHVTITTDKEHYTMSKVMPNMMVNNVIWGVKYLMWTGTIEIGCPETGYHAHLELKELDHRNVVTGTITKRSKTSTTTTTTTTTTTDNTSDSSSSAKSEPEVIFKISGYAGDKVYISPPKKNTSSNSNDNSNDNADSNEYDQSETSVDDADKKLLLDLTHYNDNQLEYLPREVQTEFNSLRLWKEVKRAIVANNMPAADEEKKKIEAAQRVREAARRANDTTKTGTYFTFVPNSSDAHDRQLSEDPDHDGDVVDLDQKGHWAFKDNIKIDADYIKNIKEQVEKIRAENPEAGDDDDTPATAEGGNCTVS